MPIVLTAVRPNSLWELSQERDMTITSVLIWLVIGAFAGWLAGVIVKGYGYGLFGNIVVGLLGAVLGGWLLHAIGMGANWGIWGSILGAVLGSVILLFLLRLVRRV